MNDNNSTLTSASPRLFADTPFQTGMKEKNTNLFFLIGFMGSGKSLLSQGVSRITDATAVEMDEEIEKSAGMSINSIFKEIGEKRFRKLEREILHDLITRNYSREKILLISTGGGVPCYFDNMEVMNKTGTTIFINPSAQRLSGRLELKKQDRPLIKDKSSAEIKKYVEEKLNERLAYYNKARIHVNMIYDDKSQNINFLKDIIKAPL